MERTGDRDGSWWRPAVPALPPDGTGTEEHRQPQATLPHGREGGPRTPGPPVLLVNARVPRESDVIDPVPLVGAARRLGARVCTVLGDAPGDVVRSAEAAVAEGAGLLAVFGGQLAQALVAGVAVRHGTPLLVVPTGPHDRFPRDLGLNGTDPLSALDALVHGRQVRVDVGRVAGVPFLNAVTFRPCHDAPGAPGPGGAWRREGREAARGRGLRVDVGPAVLAGAHSLLVTNNLTDPSDLTGRGPRNTLDLGVLGVQAVTYGGRQEPAGPVMGWDFQTFWRGSAFRVVVDAGAAGLTATVDGRPVRMPAPVSCWIQPRALVVQLPDR